MEDEEEKFNLAIRTTVKMLDISIGYLAKRSQRTAKTQMDAILNIADMLKVKEAADYLKSLLPEDAE